MADGTREHEGSFQALALTGGGYRGLFTAKALAEIEAHTGRPIGSNFDLLCGTSIGGIIALAAAFDVEMATVVDAFTEYGRSIFPPRPKPSSKLPALIDLWSYRAKPRYDDRPLRNVVEGIIPRGATLADAKHAVIIPAINVTEGSVQVFKTRHVAKWTRDWKLSAVDIAMATSAAPTYFPLARIGNSRYVDGGLFANAPDFLALHEAEHFLGIDVNDFALLSVGTTTKNYSIAGSVDRGLGIADWLQGDSRLLNLIISSQQQLVDQVMQHRLGSRYIRIDHAPSHEQAEDLGLDIATDAAQETLLGLAEKSVSNVLATHITPLLSHTPKLNPFAGEV